MDEIGFDSHSLILEDRKKLNVSGVKEVVAFDDETIRLDTVMGQMTVKGEGLRITGFNTETGELSAEGKLHAAVYLSGTRKPESLLARLFR